LEDSFVLKYTGSTLINNKVGIEIERKFLVSNDEWRESSHPDPYSQGYLISDQTRTVEYEGQEIRHILR
jgi:CYTH domain-containing protein